MMKWVDPIVTRFRVWPWPRPRVSFVTHHSTAEDGAPTLGQRLAERVAAGVGSWTFLIIQSGFLFLWLVYNTLQFTTHFDPPPYILLNLLLSFQAAFTGPVLLIAANVGAARDHKQADRIEGLAKQNEDLSAQNEQLVERLLNLEQMLDTHVASSLKAHTDELHDLGALVRAVHAVVCDGAQTNGGSQTLASAPTQESLAAVAVQPTPEPGASASEPAAPPTVTTVRSAASGTRQGKGRARRS